MAELQKQNSKTRVDFIKQATNTCLENKKCLNKILDILNCIEDEDKKVVLECIKSLSQILQTYMQAGDVCIDKKKSETSSGMKKGEQLRLWLIERYEDVMAHLTQLVTHTDSDIQDLSLATFMKLFGLEIQHPLWRTDSGRTHFPSEKLQDLWIRLISKDRAESIILRTGQYLDYDDVRFHTLVFLKTYLSEVATLTDTQMTNIFKILEQISLPADPEQELFHFIGNPPESGQEKSDRVSQYKEHQRFFSTVWVLFLSKKMPASLYRKILVMLHEKVMPFMQNPLRLSDFLVDSYNIGGAISLLALNGLFILVNKYNLTYPDFYGKLYALFEPSIFHVKYRARFFYLSDLFLTSTHLPAYLVAAFVKRLARISLTAPPAGLLVSVPFIYNLLMRHPNCKALLHNPASDLKDDPYNPDEKDLSKCNALQSSLWELKTLQRHYHPDVVRLAQKMDQPLVGMETDLSPLLETTHTELFEKETKKKMKIVPTNYNVPKGLLWTKEDKMRQCWLLE